MLKARDNFLHNVSDAENTNIEHYASQVLFKNMSAEGVGFVGDIGNSLIKYI